MEINYTTGDATSPKGDGTKIIVHICNDIGKWGKGFVLAISKKWKEPEKFYKESFSKEPKPKLGEVQFVAVSDGIYVANIIGQHGIARKNSNTKPIRYDAVEEGLHKVAEKAKQLNASVHMPRIGCGLAGGTWVKIEEIISQTLIIVGVSTTVYDYK